MDRKDILGLIGSFAVTIVLFVALWVFIDRYWVSLPAWLGVLICIAVAVGAIGAPIFSLARISNRMMERQRAVARSAPPVETDKQP